MAEALLKGRYYSQLRKLGAIGMVATGITGVAVYFGVYAKRNKLYADYQSSLTKEKLNEIDLRIQKYAGVKYNKNFPNFPMIEMKSEEGKENFEKLQTKLLPTYVFWKLACHQLADLEPDICNLVAKVHVGIFRVNENSSASRQNEFAKAKEQLQEVIKKYLELNHEKYLPYAGMKESELPADATLLFMHALNEGTILEGFNEGEE